MPPLPHLPQTYVPLTAYAAVQDNGAKKPKKEEEVFLRIFGMRTRTGLELGLALPLRLIPWNQNGRAHSQERERERERRFDSPPNPYVNKRSIPIDP